MYVAMNLVQELQINLKHKKQPLNLWCPDLSDGCIGVLLVFNSEENANKFFPEKDWKDGFPNVLEVKKIETQTQIK